MTPIVVAPIVAVVFLTLFGVFGAALIVQFRGDRWLPEWTPMSLRRRSSNLIIRALAIGWTAAWSVGGQLVVLLILSKWIQSGELIAATILGLEVVAAVALAVLVLQVPSRSATET